MKESIIENACFEFGNKQPDFFVYKIPDQREFRNGAYRKNPMMPAGQLDLIVIHNSGITIHVEIKNETGKLSEKQKVFMSKLNQFNVPNYVCKSLGEFKNVINQIRDKFK